ncbi:37S ribosomal protein-like protein Rsm22 [Dendryphion nanum]|uniref:37S ribosomal protein-like protein Rsm22 n=1 Tax=Dendryphion nanum TaxID=256645 RepID=A0A9P9DX50_9PLEO|nr:37S ribosomal protein-like protein Rsm22 [Dendryphion nanum]
MLVVRNVPSFSLICRSKIAVLPAPSARFATFGRLSQPARHLRTSTSSLEHRRLASKRKFSTNASQDDISKEQAQTPPEPPQDLPPFTPQLSKEAAARKARQVYGDVLPRGHLTEEELVVYERLFGAPVMAEKVEEPENLGGKEAEVVEKTLPDGSTVLLRKGEDGELEEVDVFEQLEEEELGAEEENVEGTESIDLRTKEEWDEVREQQSEQYHQDMYEKSMRAYEQDVEAEDELDEDFMRAHPLTIAGRFKPSPSTIYLPKGTFVDPITTLLTRANHKHLAESANQVFGGSGLPHSATTAASHLNRQQKPIPIDPSHSDIGSIQADAYLAAVMPGTYAAVTSTLVEVRRRLGSTWIERLLKRKGGPVVLDAGAGGAGILAWNEVLKAEWARIQADEGKADIGAAPLGKSTVLTGADTLRHRASRLLENTTFIPRLPDAITAQDEANASQPRKVYDLIIAPHALWSLRQEYLRKEQVDKYWSLLNPKGGVLIILEKGLPRGFEVVAAARQHLLDKHIASPNSAQTEAPLEEQVSSPDQETRFIEKEPGMIIAPCTNHNTCPMYQSPGISAGRKDFCYFSQRYIRPPFLQRILDATDRNHEDVQFSYIAVQRGRDHRLALHDPINKGVVQDEKTTTAAFEGHEWKSEGQVLTPADVNPLSLPRLILPALKRRGHITFDVCTPAGKLERWTVPRSFSKQAFRDARKARWGDLWALGAKTRTPRNVRLGRPRDEFDRKGRRIKAEKRSPLDLMDENADDEGMGERKNSRRYTQDRKIRGSGGRKGRKIQKGRTNEYDDDDE